MLTLPWGAPLRLTGQRAEAASERGVGWGRAASCQNLLSPFICLRK